VQPLRPGSRITTTHARIHPWIIAINLPNIVSIGIIGGGLFVGAALL